MKFHSASIRRDILSSIHFYVNTAYKPTGNTLNSIFLLIFKESIQSHNTKFNRGEKLILKTELTSRDKDHVRVLHEFYLFC